MQKEWVEYVRKSTREHSRHDSLRHFPSFSYIVYSSDPQFWFSRLILAIALVYSTRRQRVVLFYYCYFEKILRLMSPVQKNHNFHFTCSAHNRIEWAEWKIKMENGNCREFTITILSQYRRRCNTIGTSIGELFIVFHFISHPFVRSFMRCGVVHIVVGVAPKVDFPL